VPGSYAARWESLISGPEFFCADRWGWPPTVTAEQPALLLDDLINVTMAVEAHRREQAEREE
jgi:hypothetical protein